MRATRTARLLFAAATFTGAAAAAPAAADTPKVLRTGAPACGNVMTKYGAPPPSACTTRRVILTALAPLWADLLAIAERLTQAAPARPERV